jgi:Fe-S-cluster containining protein
MCSQAVGSTATPTHQLEDEARLPWLSILLDMQQTINAGVAEGIVAGEAAGRRLACTRGCATCCRTHGDIPVYPLELMGVYWFAVEKLAGDLRQRVRSQLENHKQLDGCPFLVDEACAIHPVRPMACRLFNVFDTVCGQGEDAFHTRPADVLPPPEAAKREALMAMLGHHQVASDADRATVVDSGAVHQLAKNLRELPWENLALRMQAFDQRRQAINDAHGDSP